MFKPGHKISLDTETTGLRPWLGDRAYVVTMCDDNGETYFTRWPVNPFTREVTPNPKDLAYLRKVLSVPERELVLFNRDFDLRMLEMIGIEPTCTTHDVYLKACIWNNLNDIKEGGIGYGLKAQSEKYCGIPADDQKMLRDAVTRGRRVAKLQGWMIAEGDRYGEDPAAADYWIPHLLTGSTEDEEYARNDGTRTYVLDEYYNWQFSNESDGCWQRTYDQIEQKLFPVIYEMVGRGVSISREVNEQEKLANFHKMEMALANMRHMIGDIDFNPGSPKQLCYYLYEHYHLTVEKYTDKRSPSTDFEAVQPHINHPFVQQLMAYRSGKKALDTFFEKYDLLMVPDPTVPGGWCLHPGINQLGAKKTSRFSMNDPNLQQVANAKTHAKANDPIQARGPFGPRPGYVLYLLDFAQQEVRIFADVAQSKPMIEAALSGRDINTENSNRAWGGEGNPFALEACAYALELGSSQPATPQVAVAWKELDWSPGAAASGVTSSRALAAADEWMARHGYDITLAEKSLDKKSSRGRAKMIIFAFVYGGGASAVQKLLGSECTEQQARRFMAQFERFFPEVKQYMRDLSDQARKDGFVITRYGRKLRVDENYAYRAVNYSVQGCAADMMKDSMIRCREYLRRTGADGHIWLTVHDELGFEIRKEHAYKWLLRGIKTLMEDTQGRMRVPMKVEVSRARERWDVKEEVEL